MKNILLFAFIVLCFNLVQAQVEISIEPSPAYGEAVLDQPSTNPQDVVAHALITNSSSEAKTFVWTRNIVEKPDKWGSGVCDVNFCYAPHVDSEEFTLSAGQSATMDVHVYPSGSLQTLDGAVPGSATIQVTVTEVGNDANTTVGEYIFNVDETVSSLSNLEIQQLQLFPNPTISSFELQGPEGVEYVKIYNLLGTEIRNYNHNTGRKYDVAELSRGLYLIALLDEDAQLLKTVRLQKQ